MKHFFPKAAVVAAVGLACVQAQAAGFSTFGGQHDAFEIASQAVTPGLFDDVFSFTLSAASTITGVAVANNNVPTLSITQGTFALYSTSDVYSPIFTGLFNGSTGSTGLTATLAAGSYYYEVIGKANGVGGGTYTLTSTVTPVPEPETYALFLAGLGAIGFLTARRRSN